MLSKSDGEYLLKLARRTIEAFTRNEKLEPAKNYPKILDEKCGMFCTIHKFVDGKKQLRGCIGVPYPVIPLIKVVASSAVSACEDPRFSKLQEDELKDIKIEISVLTKPELIDVKSPWEYLEKIEPHKDGLIIECAGCSGLFLPQVWGELPDKEEFLEHLCLKAGLPPDTWHETPVKIYKFQVQAWEEK